MPQTITEKIVQSHAVGLGTGHKVGSGDIVRVRPAHIMTHDNTGAVLSKFKSMGAVRMADPRQPVFALDHDVQNHSPENLARYDRIEKFAAEMGVVFHPAGEGIGHQLMMERGFVHPGSLVVASDSHSNTYGALAALGTPVVRTDAAAIWATGSTWWQVPRTVRVLLEGCLRPGVHGKDVIIALCALYNRDEVLNCVVEFHGSGIDALSMPERMAIANMTTEWGALAGWFPFDRVTAAYLSGRADRLAEMGIRDRLTREMVRQWEADPPHADSDAGYAGEIRLDLGSVVPQVSGPDTVFAARAVRSLAAEKVRIDKAYLLSCVNGRYEDLEQAAGVLRGKKIADGVRLYLAAASREIEEKARDSGIWQVILEAGAVALPPGCGACIGLGEGLLEPGETGISATNRNFKGRMGDRNARTYLASPSVVAASALAGYICGDTEVTDRSPSYRFQEFRLPAAARNVELLDGFAERIEGRILLLPVDNLNTDGIYGKDATYRDGLTPEEMAGFAMANYDPEFQGIVREGDILVSGRNFGTGSSREQAATALKYRGIRLIIAASFSQTYLRNAFNNAFICLESPALYDAVSQSLDTGEKGRTIPCGPMALDIRRSVAEWKGREYPVSPMGPAAQALILAGGLEALTAREILNHSAEPSR